MCVHVEQNEEVVRMTEKEGAHREAARERPSRPRRRARSRVARQKKKREGRTQGAEAWERREGKGRRVPRRHAARRGTRKRLRQRDEELSSWEIGGHRAGGARCEPLL